MSKNAVLAIDTSGTHLQLCLKTNAQNHLLSESLPRGHAEVIFDKIAELLQQNYIKYADIAKIGVTVGPGSFTGLRIGIAAARGLALALKIPVIGIPNLFALSTNNDLVGSNPFYLIVDARRDQFYVQQFAQAQAPLSEPLLLEHDEVELLRADPNNKIYSDAKIDIVQLCDFTVDADPEIFPPRPTYIRSADAKPQSKGKIAKI
ncbi:MAG: tRNA (adenosine(37)-N6)-threonylcarbamoyltransferase complex dimerization subunit type 1 TsaB [Devosiaceae bacterium]|nr:tRNA (adenosine(37)-N6)-threonylcarbamoyltransferase complex dimerization subunit type 1 TsaB [Devosiaceae bacterium]